MYLMQHLIFMPLILALSLSFDLFQHEPSISQAFTKSKELKRTLILYFHGDECTGCIQTDAFFERPEIRQAISEKFVSAEVDIDNFDGKACQQIYGIQHVPAVLFVDMDGTILYRAEKSFSLGELEGRITGGNTIRSSATENTTSSISREPESPRREHGHNTIPKTELMHDASGNVGVSGSHFHVQVGYFGSQVNAERLAGELQNKSIDAFLKEEMRNGKTNYRVLIGHYSTEHQAKTEMSRIQTAGYEARIYKS